CFFAIFPNLFLFIVREGRLQKAAAIARTLENDLPAPPPHFCKKNPVSLRKNFRVLPDLFTVFVAAARLACY
ncbi:MAG: hypothetical protein RR320_08295, partial [Oscillospiraceae bacterium]